MFIKILKYNIELLIIDKFFYLDIKLLLNNKIL